MRNIKLYSWEYEKIEHERAKRKRGFKTNVSRNKRGWIALVHLAGLLTFTRVWFEDNATYGKGTLLPSDVALYTNKQNLRRFWRVHDFLTKLFHVRLTI